MKKVILINGSPRENGNTSIALGEIETRLHDLGVETETIRLGTKPMQGCIACYSCKKTGKCVFDDLVNETAEKIRQADGLIVGSPVYYAGPAGTLCAFMDRLFCSAGNTFDGKPAACVAVCRRGGASATFDRLNKYFTICNMPVVPSQYWNSVHGAMPGEAKQDVEGLQTMRTLADNFAWMLRALDSHPEREPRQGMNFIR